MKPEATVYEQVTPLPPDWRKNRKKGTPEVYTAYCAGCGRLLPLKRDEGIAGKDENGKPYLNQCLFCEELANLPTREEA